MDKIDLLDEESAISEDLTKTNNANGKSHFKLLVLGVVVFQCFWTLKFSLGDIFNLFGVKLNINPFFNYLLMQALSLSLIILAVNYYIPKISIKAILNIEKIDRLIFFHGILMVLLLAFDQLLFWIINSFITGFNYEINFDDKYWDYIDIADPILHILGITLILFVMWKSISKL